MPAHFKRDERFNPKHSVDELAIRSGRAVRGDEFGVQFISGGAGKWTVFSATPEQALMAAAKLVHSAMATHRGEPVPLASLTGRSKRYHEHVRLFKAALDELIKEDGRVEL